MVCALDGVMGSRLAVCFGLYVDKHVVLLVLWWSFADVFVGANLGETFGLCENNCALREALL